MRRLLIATTNPRKGTEMLQILTAAGLDFELVTLAEYPDAPPVEETGETFLANARLKATAGAALSGLLTIADDGGLMIDALDGAPGVYSHRFLGMETPFPEKMRRILEMMQDVPDEKRTCRFLSTVAAADSEGVRFECVGTCEGRIAHELRGEYGFGYDPIFLLTEIDRHMAELQPEEKHRISHRGKALACAIEKLRSF